MADIELVIKINENIAQGIIDGVKDEPRNIVRNFQATIAYAIKNGTPLPKGHGDLIDRDKLKTHFVGTEQGTDLEVYLETTIINAHTIIEADKAESENEE